jgi:hypothetical protein|tara:strand:+ start:272 stop:505 length:234 start_codon:yes stop_codon:yes gene_type:complete
MTSSTDGLYINIPTPSTNMINWLISTAWTMLFFYGIFLSFKCNKGTFNLGHFLAALFAAPLYVLYQFANNFSGCYND